MRGRTLVLTVVAASALMLAACTDDTDIVNPSALPDGEFVDGASAYLRRCGGCHGAIGTAQNELSLVGLGDRPPESIRQVIELGQKAMPGFGGAISDAEIDAIVTYVLSES